MVRKKTRAKSFNATPIKLKCPELIKPHLQNFENFVKMSASSSCSQKYKIGDFPLILYDAYDCMNAMVAYLHFKEDSTECFLWWEEIHDGNEKQVKFSFATCEVSYEVLKALASQNQFHLIWETIGLQSKNTCVHVCINSNLIVPLNYASEPHVNRCRSKIQTIVKHFYGIAVEEYGKDFVDEEDHVEKFMINHILYSELLLSDGSKLYYQMYGGFFVTKQFTSLPLAKGGILADEMGLGKTVEVLACILLHPRTDIISHEEQIYKNCAAEINNDISENVKSSTKGKRRKNPRMKKEIIVNNSKRQRRNCNNFQDKQIKCRKCGLILDVSETSDLPVCLLCSDGYFSSDSQSSNSSYIYDDDDDSVSSEIEFSELQEDSFFECVCGSEFSVRRKKKTIVQCKNCGLQQHAECVLASITEESFVNYLCPYCWVEPSKEPVPSPATLIVSPSAILYQWEQEISRHIKKDGLKVFLYAGVERHRFINPKDLANYDIVLSSYEIFRKELSHVNVPHGEKQRPLRYPKKFRTLPSPLSAVEWWRICLDEAQMVEGVTTKPSQMALQLKCINRWCVTGTPIQKSIEDLYGLLLFLGYDPYHEKLWWKELLWKPFACGKPDKLAIVLNNVLWRTPKNFVLHQMGIPQQEFLVHKIEFSQIEKVFYESIRSRCIKDFMENIRKYDCEDLNLRNMDKHVLSKILLPLKKLQKACCHFQLAQNNLTDVQKNTMTIPELLDHLLKNASYECEEVHRKLILALNGVAGVFTIKEEYKNACELYKKVLLSVEEHKNVIRTDILQQIHTLHNYSKLLSLWISKTNDYSDIKMIIASENVSDFTEELKSKSAELSETYLQKFTSIMQNCKDMLRQISEEIHKIKSQFKCNTKSLTTSSWWFEILDNMNEDEKKSFIQRIKESLMDAPGRSFLPDSISISDRFHDCSGLGYTLISLSDELHAARSSLIDAVNNITLTPDSNLLNNAIECHLRPTPGHKVPRCLYCKSNDVFCQYESKLFRFNELSVSDEESSDTENICLPQLRKGTHADSEFELILKIFVNYARHRRDLPVHFEDGCNELKLFDALKKEFKQLRSTWIQMSEYVSAIDELEMAKMSMRLLLPGEKPPNPPVPYIIQPHQLQTNMMQLQSDVISNQNLLKKKLGQLFYLQNLKKAQNSEVPFEETCPVCHLKLETSWSVLQCGHSFCLGCMHMLTNSPANSLRTSIRCPVCREVTNTSDIYYIDSPQIANEEICMKGSYSTKISAVIKCLLKIKKKDPSAKSLVFSTWADLLCLLKHALTENEIAFVGLDSRRHFQENLDLFKQSSNVNVLLLPLNVGANGLNIIEATNVLLTEPVLDNSKVLQAIGRVHRIGQTRETVVHKFVISSTIEENLHEIHKNNLSSEAVGNPMTVKDLKHLFDEN
ncbi:E3 ubiquitin-protein ligase SHPRH like protein [Argiope bruennichi]|uniref:E3 ubiquitin-protein ligase SHPRH like protein n=1 Tax=Argiope bruennichi TaxID=94029 RepID=A0A8T0F0S8_ARGBR|nr:E3 ubiquitin-protein ligase SHPRH like protein [Argiope bruennichi]